MTFHLQYWHEHAMEWRGAGFKSEDYDAVVGRMFGARRQCDDCVRFRIAGPYADLSQPLAESELPF